MARPGVGYKEVSEAANQLAGQGKNPTIEQVRLLLGTGSSTTIANHLRDWKEGRVTHQASGASEAVPSELSSLVKGLWERVIAQAAENFNAKESSYLETIAELKKELFKYKNNNQRWQRLFNKWVKDKEQLVKDKYQITQAFTHAQKENISLSVKLESIKKQLQKAEERVEELRDLHQQAQINLEHLRESAREQRLIDQQQFDQQLKMLKEAFAVAS